MTSHLLVMCYLCRIESYLASLLTLTQHHDAGATMLPHHTPEVCHSVGHGALSQDVLVSTLIALQGREHINHVTVM